MLNSNAELRSEWERRVSAFRASGMTGAAWCAANNVKPHKLWYWVGIFKKAAVPISPSRWLPVEVGEPESGGDHGSTLLIRVGPAAIEVKPGFNMETFSDVVRILASLC